MRPVRACTTRFRRFLNRAGRGIDILFIFGCNRSRLPNGPGCDTAWPDRLVFGVLTPCSKRKCQCPEEQDPIAPQFHESEISDINSIGASRSATRRTSTYDFAPRSISSTSYPSGASMKAILVLPVECGPSDNG